MKFMKLIPPYVFAAGYLLSGVSYAATVDGKPTYSNNTDSGLYVWRMPAGFWKVRLVGGGGNQKFTGVFEATRSFGWVKRVRLESDDKATQSEPGKLHTRLQVVAGGEDGIDFGVDGAGVCLRGSGSVVYLGQNAVPVAMPVDLTNSGACGGSLVSANTPPSIAGNPASSVTAGTSYNFQPTASDLDRDNLIFSIHNQPGWASFNASTGRLYGTPTNHHAGSVGDIVISVSDGFKSATLPPFSITVVPSSEAFGNFDPSVISSPADFLYVDVNSEANGSGLTPNDPTNKIPIHLGDRRQLFFNSDNGVQTIPCRNNGILVNGNNIQISSYGSGRATVSAYQIFNGGWSRVGTSNVWRQSYSGGAYSNGPVVGNMIDLSSTKESPNGDVLGWQNMEEEGDKAGVFRNDPTVLAAGKYAYDWQNEVMYVNVGANPNNRKLGISCVGRFINTLIDASPTNVTVHNLNIIGFSRASINIKGGSNNWHVHNNYFYANGGMYNVTSKWYHGSGIQMTHTANNIEINNNTLVQTFDSPITPQHFAGSADGHLSDIHIHHNYIDKWALAAVEMADFGKNNKFSRITIEDNTALNGGLGFSSTGDTPNGITDGFQIRGGVRSGVFSDLIIRRNKVNAYHANIGIVGNNFTNAVLIENNTLWGADYGIHNQRTTSAYIHATENRLCDNATQIKDWATDSQYLGNTLIDGGCPIE